MTVAGKASFLAHALASLTTSSLAFTLSLIAPKSYQSTTDPAGLD